jgi:RNA polymerase sigma-70 factor (ECF subfamily)
VTHANPKPASFLLAMHHGDQAAARALWEAHAGRLTALARTITGSHADALDAVQEAFVAVLSLSAAQAAAIDDEACYLAGAVRTRALNHLRSASRRATREREIAPLRLVGKPGDDPALEEALQSLTLDARELVALKHLAGLTFDQMAVALGVPRATVSTRYYSAIEHLRSALGVPRSTREVARA